MKYFLLVAMIFFPLRARAVGDQEYVILLHGLCRTSHSMDRMEEALAKSGYHVVNVDYPSRTASIERLSEDAVGFAVSNCQSQGAQKIHFVTHSAGGILVRCYLSQHTIPNLGRTVMLGPPNHGSEMVDKFKSLWLFKQIDGPAGGELGTDKDSMPYKLGGTKFCVGVIAGDCSMHWINSLLIPGHDDGMVSVECTKLDGMADFIVVPATHTFIMRKDSVIRQTLAFLKTGRFEKK